MHGLYSSVSRFATSRKRKQEDGSEDRDIQPASAMQQFSWPATGYLPSEPTTKRQRLPALSEHSSAEDPYGVQMQSAASSCDKRTQSGQMQHCQPMMQSDLHWTASDGYSTSNSATPKQDVMMEEDQRVVTPASQWQHQVLPRSSGMSNSSSAPDLRLMLTTEIPQTRPMFLPNPGSYAGAMVPYKGPEGDMMF